MKSNLVLELAKFALALRGEDASATSKLEETMSQLRADSMAKFIQFAGGLQGRRGGSTNI